MPTDGIQLKSARPIQKSIDDQLVLDIGVAQGDIDLARHALVAQGHRTRSLANVDLIHPLARDEFHALKNVQPTRTGLIVEHDLGVLAVEPQHPNLFGPRHGIRKAGVHRRIGLKGLTQIAAGRPAQFIPTERLHHQRVQQTHRRRRAFGDDLGFVELEALSQRDLDVVLSDERQLHRGHANEAGHQRVAFCSLQPEEAVSIRRGSLSAALPDDIGTRQGQPILFFPTFSPSVVRNGLVNLVLGEHLALDHHGLLSRHRETQQDCNPSKEELDWAEHHARHQRRSSSWSDCFSRSEHP